MRTIANKQELINEGHRLRSDGLSYNEIARRLGVSGSCVQRWLKPESAERHNARARERYAIEDYRRDFRARQTASRNERMLSIEFRIEDALRKMRLKAKNRNHSPCITPVGEIAAAFDGHCAICRVAEVGCPKRLAIDHDHTTGEFRGWLCEKCNRSIGHVEAKMLPYLRYLLGDEAIAVLAEYVA